MTRHSLSRVWVSASLFAAFCLPLSSAARAQDVDHINLTYWGGPLLQHPKVATLFWGSYWSFSPQVVDYFNSFFKGLFADGRYLLTLQQYSAGGYRIGNGQFLATDTDPQTLPDFITDDRIQAEILTQIAAGSLPQPDPDTIYFVFIPPNVTVSDSSGNLSEKNFSGYHTYVPAINRTTSGFAYALIAFTPATNSHPFPDINTYWMTGVCSHELAEAVTDPQPGLGWYDQKNGEVGDIPRSLRDAGRIDDSGLWDFYIASDGRQFNVQREWSNWDKAPVALAWRSFFPTDGDAFSPAYLTPDRKSRNLLQNGSFESGAQGWSADSYRGGSQWGIVTSPAHDGTHSLNIQQLQQDDDTRVRQTVSVKPNTRYLLSGWVMTRNARVVQPGGKVAANLSIWQGYNHSQSLPGTANWTYLALVFNSGAQTQLDICARLGNFGSTASGAAWFDDLCLIELP